MLLNPGFIVRFAPLLASLALIASCCYLYDIPSPTPVPVPSATPTCQMSFTSPSSGAVLSSSGLVKFAWTAVAHAKFYIFSISAPGNPNNTNYPTNNTSWPVDMGSVGGGGSYKAFVQARDNDQNIMCQAELDFFVGVPTATPTLTPTVTLTPTQVSLTKTKKPHSPVQPTMTKTSKPPTKVPPTATHEPPKSGPRGGEAGAVMREAAGKVVAKYL